MSETTKRLVELRHSDGERFDPPVCFWIEPRSEFYPEIIVWSSGFFIIDMVARYPQERPQVYHEADGVFVTDPVLPTHSKPAQGYRDRIIDFKHENFQSR